MTQNRKCHITSFVLRKSRIFLLVCFGFLSAYSYAENVSVLDFNAKSDGTTLTTQFIQDAIDHCANTGGGTVTIPPGTYLIHTVFLKSNVNVHIDKGAVLLADIAPGSFTLGLLYGDGIENSSITGLGVIDGQGYAKNFPKDGPRQNNLHLYRCKNVRVTDITMLNSSSWSFKIRECDEVIVRGVKIYSYANQNNDGIDIEGKNVVISDCIVDCEDDAICLKSSNPDFLVENIAITNCIVATNCNGIKFGTASHCGFKNITISNCIVRRPSDAAKLPPRSTLKGCDTDTIGEIGLALEIVDGGFMDQITVSNISMTGIQTPLFIRLANRSARRTGSSGNPDDVEHGNEETPKPGTLKNVVISNITATDETMLNSSITGIPGSYVENVIVRDVIFNSKGTGTMAEAEKEVPEKIGSYPQANLIFGYSVPAYGMYVRHVKNLVLDNFIFNLNAPDARPAVMLDDCHNVRLSNFDVDIPTHNQPILRFVQSTDVAVSGYRSAQETDNFLRLEGEKSDHIWLTGNDFSNVENIVEFMNGADESAVKSVNNFTNE